MAVTRIKTLGTVTVATAGTPVAIFSGLTPKPKIVGVIIRALASNSGNIFVGDSSVLASSNRGDKLPADFSRVWGGFQSNTGGTMLIDIDNLYIDASANNQSVDVVYVEVI